MIPIFALRLIETTVICCFIEIYIRKESLVFRSKSPNEKGQSNEKPL